MQLTQTVDADPKLTQVFYWLCPFFGQEQTKVITMEMLGIFYKLQVAHLKLCFSRAFWLVAYPSQGHEMLFDAHTRSFAALGGVPRRGIYDNMKTAVDSQLARGLHANSVRRHINMLNAMVNMAFKHLDIDRLSPFRRLYIRGEGELSRTMAPITVEHLRKVKAHLLSHPIPSRLAALIQLNTGMRISEPVLARLDDLVLDHYIPHLWVRKNSLTDRKTQASIRCVPLLGVSLEAAQELHRRAARQKATG